MSSLRKQAMNGLLSEMWLDTEQLGHVGHYSMKSTSMKFFLVDGH